VEDEEVEAEEAVEEGVAEAATAAATLRLAAEVTVEALQRLPQAVPIPGSPELVAEMGPGPVVVLEAEVAARVGNSALFCGSRAICLESSNPSR
jgi:hypothetical protein